MKIPDPIPDVTHTIGVADSDSHILVSRIRIGICQNVLIWIRHTTVCQGSSDPPEKIFYIFASENEAYTIY